MKEELKPGSIWTPTKDAGGTFPRRVETVKPGRSSQYDRVVFRRVLKDGALGVTQASYTDSWHAWVRQFGAVSVDAPKDKTEALREALTKARSFIAQFHADSAAAFLHEIDAALRQ